MARSEQYLLRSEAVADFCRDLLDCSGWIVSQRYLPNCCVAATKIALGACEFFGVECEEWACLLLVMNRPYHDWCKVQKSLPMTDSEMQEAFAGGGHSIGVGFGADGPADDYGHLIAVAERQWLLDLSIRQACRPEHGINLQPTLGRLTSPPGRDHPQQAFQMKDGTGLLYIWLPETEAYKKAPDWSSEDRTKDAIDDTVSQLKGRGWQCLEFASTLDRLRQAGDEG